MRIVSSADFRVELSSYLYIRHQHMEFPRWYYFRLASLNELNMRVTP